MITVKAHADIDIVAATTLYQHQCIACHGIDGVASMPIIPHLAGQLPGYLAKALRDYQQGMAGVRPNAIMLSASHTLTTQDITNLSAYLSTQTPSSGSVPKSYFDLGQKLYRAGDQKRAIPACTACHGPAGTGNRDANYPALTGQHSAYLIRQLQLFAADIRKSDPKGMMRDIAKRLTPEDQLAVAHFINGLH